MAVDADEVTEAIAVEEAVEEVGVDVEGVGTQVLVPVVVHRDYHMISPLRYKMMAPP